MEKSTNTSVPISSADLLAATDGAESTFSPSTPPVKTAADIVEKAVVSVHETVEEVVTQPEAAKPVKKTRRASAKSVKAAAGTKTGSAAAVHLPSTIRLAFVPERSIDPDVPALYDVCHAVVDSLTKLKYAITPQEPPEGSLALCYLLDLRAKRRGRKSSAKSNADKSAEVEVHAATVPDRLALLTALMPVVTALFESVAKKQEIKVALACEGVVTELDANDFASSGHSEKRAKHWAAQQPALVITPESLYCLLVLVPKRVTLAV